MQEYVSLKFNLDDSMLEIFIAQLYELGFESFVEDQNFLEAFIEKNVWLNIDKQSLELLCININATYEVIVHQNKDWNAIWEASFEPISILNQLYIRAPFHPMHKTIHDELIIAPKMAFGTGHHETTSLTLEWMVQQDWHGKYVLDFGCGTGILGIYAKKKHCDFLVFIDNEEEAILNTKENCELNQVKGDLILLGSTDQLPDIHFDCILANITRNVLLETLEELRNCCKPLAHIIISGFHESDEKILEAALIDCDFNIVKVFRKDSWSAILAQA